jgi:Mlc titration factor MtfA (ptsG expression regulator)
MDFDQNNTDSATLCSPVFIQLTIGEPAHDEIEGRMQIGARYTPGRQVRSIVPGDHLQVQKDLETFPEPVLNLLDGYGVKVAVLDDNQTLENSPALRHLSQSEYAAEKKKARDLTIGLLSKTEATTLEEFAESATRELRKKGLDFHYGVSSGEVPLEYIAEQQDIPSEHVEDWKQSFQELNVGFPSGFFILPHTYHEGRPIPENRLRTAKETTAEYVERSLGLNRAEDRLVLLHKKFTPAQAVEVGNYRLAIHEMGHALDHVLDRVVGVPGFGTLHRETVDAMYEADLKKAEKLGVENVFTTDRASENVREYFAEAVEAYLTFPQDNAGEFFRSKNSNPDLKRMNPIMHAYMDKIMSTSFTQENAPDPPPRPLFPPFVPDPDAQVYTF